jgi:hypothetical protein
MKNRRRYGKKKWKDEIKRSPKERETALLALHTEFFVLIAVFQSSCNYNPNLKTLLIC